MIPYIVENLAPNSTNFTRGLVKYVPGRGYFCAVPSQNGDKVVTSPPPPIIERLQRVSKLENSSSVDGKNSGNQHNFIVDCAPVGGDAKFCCKCKGESNYKEKATTSRIPHHLALGSQLRRVISPYFKKLTAFNSWWIQDRQSISLIQS